MDKKKHAKALYISALNLMATPQNWDLPPPVGVKPKRFSQHWQKLEYTGTGLLQQRHKLKRRALPRKLSGELFRLGIK